jgi:hypothetical protein
MKFVRTIATSLFYITRVFSWLLWAVAIYVTIVLLLAKMGSDAYLPIAIGDGGFTIFYPFTNTAFILGDFNTQFIVSSLATIYGYAAFTWLLSNVFNAFRKDRLFSQHNINWLTRFYLFNLIVPVLTAITLVVMAMEMGNIVIIALLHIIAGIFTFFMTAIFKQGLILQNEQDLTL